MYSISHILPINALPERVWDAVATPRGLDQWWTLKCEGDPSLGNEYTLYFGPEYHWLAEVTSVEPGKQLSLTLTKAEPDWLGSVVSFGLSKGKGGTRLKFEHSGWSEWTDHFATSNYCWAMYLRIMKRFVENGEQVAYEDRLSV